MSAAGGSAGDSEQDTGLVTAVVAVAAAGVLDVLDVLDRVSPEPVMTGPGVAEDVACAGGVAVQQRERGLIVRQRSQLLDSSHSPCTNATGGRPDSLARSTSDCSLSVSGMTAPNS